jgi:thioester reductase-like protein
MNTPTSQGILLTGATGVVGARLLAEILAKTSANVFCLLRGKDENESKKRLANLLNVYDPENRLADAFSTRVIVILGDLSKNMFALERPKYKQLMAQIDRVFHVAANVSMIANYKQLAEVNVQGTVEVIDFCLAGNIPLLYTSSYSVMGSKAFQPGFVFKENHLDIGQKFEYQDYEKSKWEAEKRIHQAGEKGLRWIIVRLGDVFGDSDTGCYPLTQTTNRSIYYEIIKSITDTGLFFFGYDPLYLTPVNYVASACLYLAFNREATTKTFHLCNPDVQLMYNFVNSVVNNGYRVKLLPLEEYLSLFRSNMVFKNDRPYSSSFTNLMLFLEYAIGLEALLASDPGQKTVLVDTTNAQQFLHKAGINCSPINQELMSKYLNYCVKQGFIASADEQSFALIKS